MSEEFFFLETHVNTTNGCLRMRLQRPPILGDIAHELAKANATQKAMLFNFFAGNHSEKNGNIDLLAIVKTIKKLVQLFVEVG
jgi:hypothetical protein